MSNERRLRIAEETLFRIALTAPLGSYAQWEAVRALTLIRDAKQ